MESHSWVATRKLRLVMGVSALEWVSQVSWGSFTLRDVQDLPGQGPEQPHLDLGSAQLVSRGLEQRPAGVPSSRHLPLGLWATSLWCLWVIYFAVLGKGTRMYKKRGLEYYNRPLTPSSSTGKVCSGAANIEGAALLKIVSMESVVCPSSASRVRRCPSHSQKEERSVLHFVILHWALPTCVSKRSRGPPLGRLKDSSEIFRWICYILTVILVCPQESFYD